MLKSISFIRYVHTLIFVILSLLLGFLLYEVVIDRITLITWLALILFSAEGFILFVFEWRCPLTVYTESLGASHGQVTDIFLPRWFADRIFYIYGGIFALAVLLLVIRLLK